MLIQELKIRSALFHIYNREAQTNKRNDEAKTKKSNKRSAFLLLVALICNKSQKYLEKLTN